MLNRKLVWGCCQGVGNGILCGLDLGRERIEVVSTVQIKIHSVVTQTLHVGLASGSIALGIRGPHICGILSNDICDCSLILHHLLLPHVRSDLVQAVVRPRMGRDLMASSYHSREKIWIWSCYVDRALTKVVSRDKERRLESECVQDIEQLASVKVWSVVVSQGNYIWFCASKYIGSIWDLPQNWSWVSQCRRSSRSIVRIAFAEFVLAVWIGTVRFACSTISLNVIESHFQEYHKSGIPMVSNNFRLHSSCH